MMPNLVIVGAQKARTTSLHNSLSQHPQVYMSSRKEPHFLEIVHSNFRRPGRRSTPVTNLGDYQALTEGVSDEKASGEASASYLYSPKAPVLIKCSIPDLNSSPCCAIRQRERTRIFCTAYRSVVNPSLASSKPCRWKRHVCGIVGAPSGITDRRD